MIKQELGEKRIGLGGARMVTTDDIIKHAGVKGMKWGVRKSSDSGGGSVKVSKSEKKAQKNTDRNARNQKHHDSRKGRKLSFYNDHYDKNRASGLGHNKSMRYARISSTINKAHHLTPVVGLASMGAKAGLKGSRKLFNAATSPEAIRAGKNLVQAAKRSSIRYVDGTAMKNVINQSTSLDDIIQHAGVKGMRWGVRKSVDGGGGSKAAKGPGPIKKGKDKVIERVKDEVKSAKREASWGKLKIDNMTTEQISKVAQRAQMENDLKRMSSSKTIGSKKDKTDYLKRESMSDAVLTTKVTRLRAKEHFDRNMREASKAQRTLGRNVIDAAGPMVVTYALTGKVGVKDLTKAYNTLKRKGGGAVEPGQFKNEVGKAAFGVAGEVKVKRASNTNWNE